MKKKALRWLIGIIAVMAILLLTAILLIDPVARVLAEKRITAETGMEAQIGRFNVGLASATVHIEELILKNPAEFGGENFIEMPELFFQYDRTALREGRLHLNLVRIDVREINVVENHAGEKNIDRLQIDPVKPAPRARPNNPSPPSPSPPRQSTSAPPPQLGGPGNITTQSPEIPYSSVPAPVTPVQPASAPPPARSLPTETPETGFVFDGIDLLDVTLRIVRFTNLRHPDQNIEQDLGIRNETFRNLRTEKDFETAAALIALKAGFSFLLSGDFNTARTLLKQSPGTGKETKKIIEEIATPRPADVPGQP